MNTDFASLKKEFARLTDLQGVKTEITRLATDLQSRFDQSFARVSFFVRKSSGKKVSTVKKSSRKKAGMTTTRKKVAKKTSSKKASSRASKKTSAKSKA